MALRQAMRRLSHQFRMAVRSLAMHLLQPTDS